MIKIDKVNIDYESVPLKDYPRPILRRDSYLCLNGEWEYAITKDPQNAFKFADKVIVPYAVETPLSGVNHLFRPDEYLVYNKLVKLPDNFIKDKLILHFEGVDQVCDVYINNKKVGKHIGAYTKFSFDITELVTNNYFYISVVVIDKTDLSYHSRGKQKLKRGGIFYTSTSGIWKPVWLESVPEKYISDIRYETHFDEGLLQLKISANVDSNIMVKIGEQEVLMNTNQETLIKLEDFHPWSPEDPHLYPVEITFYEDFVRSYFGLRKIEIKETKDGHKRIFLNNNICFLKGLLDQGYYYLGNMTPESYQDYKKEIIALKSFGFNCLRKHIKTECDIFYFLCDVYGMLVIQDFINGGSEYSKKVALNPCFSKAARKRKDNHNYKLFGRENEKGRKEFIEESLEIQNELYNHPSVVMYTIFNEGWAQFDSPENYNRFRSNDPTRLYDTNSGWIDQGASDFVSTHNYFFKHKIKPDPFDQNRAQFLSEFGGLGLGMKEHFFGNKNSWGYRNYKSIDEISNAYEKLLKESIAPMIKNGLVGFIYTQVSDVEDEVNGLYTFDRKVLKIKEDVLKSCNAEMDKEIEKIEKETVC